MQGSQAIVTLTLMKSFRFSALIGIAIVISSVLGSCSFFSKKAPLGVSILTYSSLGSKGGFLRAVEPVFLAETGCALKVESTMGAAQVLSYLEEPGARERIDVVMGIDELLFERAQSYLYLSSEVSPDFKPEYKSFVKARSKAGFFPVDYGALSFIYRKEAFKPGLLKLPSKLTDLLKPEYRKKFILQDPRASSPGMLFFLFSDGILKISDLRKQWLTLAPSWDASYKMFLAHDAPMVWSYLSSLAYHATQHDEAQYGYVDFEEGLPLQIEGMSVINKVGNPFKENPCIEKWIRFVLTKPMQAKLVEKQWMMPVLEGVTLPDYFKGVPEIKKVAVGNEGISRVDSLVNRFGKEVQSDSW